MHRPPPKTLRQYQRDMITRLVAAMQDNPLAVLPTGGGKTLVMSRMIRELSLKVLWLSHRSELIEQAAASLKENHLHVGVIKAGIGPDTSAPVQVASIQTLSRRLDRLPEADIIVIDEAHRSAATQYRQVLDTYINTPRIGLTATPFRLDGRGLGDLFGEIIVGAYADELIAQGLLHAPLVYSIAPPDLRGIKVAMGEYDLDKAASKLCDPNDVVREWKDKAADMQTVGFCPNIADSKLMATTFCKAGIPAEHVDGSTPPEDRRAILQRLKSRETLIVFNVEIFVEGWDLPSLECVIFRRPTASLNFHLQALGRCMRAARSKQFCVCLDFAGNHHRHGLVTRRIEYSLDGTKKAGESDPLGLRQCRACFVLYESTLSVCPHCGDAPPLRERISGKVGDGTLVEYVEDFEYRRAIWHMIEAEREADEYKPAWSSFRYEERFGVKPVFVTTDGIRELLDTAKMTMAQKEKFYVSLLEVAKSRGMQEGWASHKYREALGVWPTGFKNKYRDDDLREQLRARWDAKRLEGAA